MTKILLKGWIMGLEPTTFGTTIRHSNQLSYTHHFCNSIFFKFGWIMGLEPTTFGTTIRHSNQLSYTHHFCNSIFFKFGWIMGLEPTTFGTTIRHSNQLSYTHRICYCGAKILILFISAIPLIKKLTKKKVY